MAGDEEEFAHSIEVESGSCSIPRAPLSRAGTLTGVDDQLLLHQQQQQPHQTAAGNRKQKVDPPPKSNSTFFEPSPTTTSFMATHALPLKINDIQKKPKALPRLIHP